MTKQKIVLLDIDYTLFNTDLLKESKLTKHELYEEVVEELGKIAEHATLAIFSQGQVEWQMNKLLKTDILKHFRKENIHISLEKKEALKDVLGKYKDCKVYLVDDRPSVLLAAKKKMPSIFAILIDRNAKTRFPEQEIVDYKPDAEVASLKELIAILKKKTL